VVRFTAAVSPHRAAALLEETVPAPPAEDDHTAAR
jgi:hypothetical protein